MQYKWVYIKCLEINLYEENSPWVKIDQFEAICQEIISDVLAPNSAFKMSTRGYSQEE